MSLQPERPYAEEIDPARLEIEAADAEHHVHQENWLDGIRLGTPQNCDVLAGAIVQDDRVAGGDVEPPGPHDGVRRTASEVGQGLTTATRAKVVRLARVAMRTRFEIVLAGDDPVRLRAAGEEALDEIDRVERLLSAFRPDSELSRINADGARAPVRVERSVLELLHRARSLSRLTEGAFDVAAGGLMKLWGFTDEARSRVPSSEELETQLGEDAFEVDEAEGTVALPRPTRAARPRRDRKGLRARSRGRRSCAMPGSRALCFNGGTSTVLAIGGPPDRDAWQIAVADPASPGRVLAEGRLRDRALSVSTTLGRTLAIGVRQIGHVLDPRTGQPVEVRAARCGGRRLGHRTQTLSRPRPSCSVPGAAALTERFPGASFLVTGEGAPPMLANPGAPQLVLAERERSA